MVEWETSFVEQVNGQSIAFPLAFKRWFGPKQFTKPFSQPHLTAMSSTYLTLDEQLIHLQNNIDWLTLGRARENSTWRLKIDEQKNGLYACSSDAVNFTRTSSLELCWGNRHCSTQDVTHVKAYRENILEEKWSHFLCIRKILPQMLNFVTVNAHLSHQNITSLIRRRYVSSWSPVLTVKTEPFKQVEEYNSFR